MHNTPVDAPSAALAAPHPGTASMLADAKRFIRIPSITSDRTACNQALEFVRARLAGIEGLTIEVFEQNNIHSFLAYMGKVRPARFKVLLNGHVDVVPAPPAMFVPTETDGRLYGRGALDMKVAVLVLTDVFCALAPHVDYSLGLQISTDEEVNGYNGARYQREQGVDCDFMLSGERTNLDITVAGKGVCWARLHFKGIPGHGAYPWDGSNAIVAMHQAMDKLLRLYPSPRVEAWQTTVNFGTVHTTNTATNRIASDATLGVDIRFVPNDPHFTDLRTTQAFLESLHPDVEAEILFSDPSFDTPENNPFVQQLGKSVLKTTGRPPTHLRRHGTADTRFYSTPGNGVVTFGLCGADPHGDHEYVEIASIGKYQQILTSFLQSIR